jgi:hypothetical protein
VLLELWFTGILSVARVMVYRHIESVARVMVYRPIGSFLELWSSYKHINSVAGLMVYIHTESVCDFRFADILRVFVSYILQTH